MVKKSEIVYAFIDSQNLNLGVKNSIKNKSGKGLRYKGWNLDFKKLYIYLKENLKVSKAFIFIGYVPDNQNLYTSLQKDGYILVFKPTLVRNNGGKKEIKGNVDAELVLHTMLEIQNYDKAVIVAGDGDYYCLVEYLAENNRLSKIVIPNMLSYSSLLRKYSRYFKYMNDLKGKLEYRGDKNEKEGLSQGRNLEHALLS